MQTTKRIKLINKKKFIKTALDKNIKALIVHLTSISLNLILIYLVKKAQIALLIIKKVIILEKYSYFAYVFLKNKILLLLEITNLN